MSAAWWADGGGTPPGQPPRRQRSIRKVANARQMTNLPQLASGTLASRRLARRRLACGLCKSRDLAEPIDPRRHPFLHLILIGFDQE
ncbi:MAG TPA: hypothetical protein VNN25_23650 [Thermoanaerobaculia bacterium]|nr:hypothetical protein [Thermoanaerobaculia bacterium]